MDIEERLDKRNFPYGFYPVMDEAKAVIKRLRAELEGLRTDRQRFADDAGREIGRLKAEKLELAKHIDGCVRVAAEALAEVKQLRAESEISDALLADAKTERDKLLRALTEAGEHTGRALTERDELLALLRSALHHVISEGDDTLATIIRAAFAKMAEGGK